MSIDLRIQELKEDVLKKNVLNEWQANGLSVSRCMEIEDTLIGDCNDCHDWYAVKNNGDTLLIFEVRRAVNRFIKTLKIYYGPDFDSNFADSGADLEAIESVLEVVVKSFGFVFAELIDQAKDTLDRTFKIYSDHSMERLFFIEIAKVLKTEYPDQYRAKFYGKWIEVEVL